MKLLLTKFKALFYQPNSSKGYTLVELLAVIIVLIVVGLVVVGILASTLRGKNKTNILNEVTQNGNRVVLQIGKSIEYAERFEGVKANPVSEPALDCISYDVITPTPSPQQYKSVLIKKFDSADSILEYSCNDSNSTLELDGESLIDSNIFKVTDCYFTCTQSFETASPAIGVHFTLSNTREEKFAERKVSVPFDTTVVMRNVNE
ncbi:hypothetical protein KKG52_01430 [Patescibacteria group bacterium]|nr:hypothetical protein [Patescibacteria group bacterium]